MTASDRLIGISTFQWLAVFAAALLALTLVPAVALGQEPVDDPEDACPEEPPPAPFTDRDDIPEAHVRNVDCAAHRGIVEGFEDGTYRPALPVTRDGMASFIARTLRSANFELPPPEQHPGFADTEGNIHEDNIRSLAAAEIVFGGPEELPPTHYGPRRVTRRDQMTSFLIRAAEWAWEEMHQTPADFGSDDQQFNDVPPGNFHFRNVNGAAEFNLTVGRTPGVFDPSSSTRRDQMASFTARLLVFLESFEEPVEETPVPTPEETPEVETFTDAPELIFAQHVETTEDGDVDVRFIFDADIGTEDVLAENFHLHTVFGENIPGDEAERDEDNDNAAIVRFEDAEDDLAAVTVAAVDHAAVVGIDEEEEQTLPNTEGSLPFDGDGSTVAPVLIQVIIGDEDNGEREIVFVFDTALDDEEDIEPGDFALYDEEGVRTELTDCDYDEDENNVVVCTVTQSPFAPIITDDEFEAAEVAVLGGVASDTVAPEAPPAETDPLNHADSEPVERPENDNDNDND
jgi:hypothetical protein